MKVILLLPETKPVLIYENDAPLNIIEGGFMYLVLRETMLPRIEIGLIKMVLCVNRS